MTQINRVNGANGGNNQPSTTKLTIKKNQGITQALFDLVKQLKAEGKAEISDGKITAQEWGKTIDKIAELQRMREEIGGQKIYSGGSDPKDYRGSFIVQPNQQIEFTVEEMNALYEAMGVSIKNTPEAPAKPETPAAPETPAKPEQPTDIPTKDENPPEDVNFVERNSNIPQKSPLTAREQNMAIFNRGKSGVKDLASGNSYDYDKDGYVKRTYDKNGKDIRWIIRNADGTVDSYYDSEYDEGGKRTREIHRNADGTVDCYYDYEYDADGHVTRVIYRNADGTVDYYEVKEGDDWVSYNPDGTMKEE